MLIDRSTVDLIIPKAHLVFAKELFNGAVILLRGWLNEKDKRIRVANDKPQFENKQAG